VEGRNLVIDRKEAEGWFERLPDLAAQLIRSRLSEKWFKIDVTPVT
jgi:hypothetical protein